MPRYNVQVTRNTTESTSVLVEADSPQDARVKAVARAKDGGLYWEADEGNMCEPYIADPDNAVEEAPPLTRCFAVVLVEPVSNRPLNVRIDAAGNLLNLNPAGDLRAIVPEIHAGAAYADTLYDVLRAAGFSPEFGLHPHADYQKARALFGDIDAAACTDAFEFGSDGKPLFLPGPFDNATRCREVFSNLVAHCGVDGFNYLLPSTLTLDVIPPALLEHQVRTAAEEHRRKLEGP
jgi:hypothetical protein